ncbi:MAG: helix-turn-helix domain-containing protein [Lachnospiraceae bacterium]
MTEKKQVEFRYYGMAAGSYVLPMLGKGWEIEYGSDQPENLLHFHNFLEIGYCYHGHGILTIGEKTYRYDGESFTFIPANILHTTTTDHGNIDKWEFLFIDLDGYVKNELKGVALSPGEILRRLGARGWFIQKDENPHLGILIRQILEECRRQEPYMQECLKGYLRALTGEMLRICDKEAGDSAGLGSGDRYSRYVESGTRYIDAHFSEDVRVADIADACGLSESHFRRIFEEATNMKPMDYLNMVRISRACDLMKKKDLTMAEIGRSVGFQTASSFNRNFRLLTGLSPLQWKKKGLVDGTDISHFRISAKQGWVTSMWEDRYRKLWEEMDRKEQEAGEPKESV